MKISFIHYSAPPVVGGVESVIQHQAILAKDAGNTVSIIAGRGERFDPEIRFVINPLLDSRHPDILNLKQDLDRGLLPGAFQSLVEKVYSDLLPALEGEDVLVVHNVASLNKNLVLTAALHQINEKPGAPGFILWHHDLAWTTPRYTQELYEDYPWNILKKRWKDAIQVVVSELRRDELCRLMGIGQDEVHVVPNGLDFDRFFKLEKTTSQLVEKLDLLASDPLLLLPVRITPRKNIEMALNILACLKKVRPAAALVVTGPLGPHNPANVEYYERLVALRKALGLENAAYFLAEQINGYLPDEVIADFYRLADALILPSLEEGFGIPILEAGISRLPIFCSDISPLKAIGGEWVTYFSPEEQPQPVADGILSVLGDSPVHKMSLRVRQNYEWKRIFLDKIEPLLHLAERRMK